MAEVVAFLIRFDLAPVSLSSKQLREIGEKHARNLHIWEIGYACVGSRWVHMQCDFVFTHQEREERFTYDIDSAKEIIPIAMRNVVVEECYFECLYGVEERGCILGAHGEIADRIVVTSSLGVLGRCFDSTERLLAFVAKFRSIKELNISSYGGVQFDINEIRGFCKRKRIESCTVDHHRLFIPKIIR